MFKKNLEMAIYSLFIPSRNLVAPEAIVDGHGMLSKKITKTKGQLRAAKGKPSGAAQLKRAAKKRANIHKHS